MIENATTPPVLRRVQTGLAILLILLCHGAPPLIADDSKTAAVLEEKFETGLSKEWTWGLGTWTAKHGVLRGFESGPRRHGPVKMRRFLLREGTLECEFRLIGKARFVGIIFNGSQERGHILHLVMSRDQIRLLAHPKKDEIVELIKEPQQLAAGEWHRVKIEFRGVAITASLNEKSFCARHPCVAEAKLTFGLGGDSGGPDGESAGALEFRNLHASADTQ